MVNVFIPLSDPVEIAKVLDDKRLGKQRVEAKQIITIISGDAKSNAWANHPVVLMWKDYLDELKYYYDIMIFEWIRRGYKNTMPLYSTKNKKIRMPWFMHCKPVILSHQASLLRKNYAHYHKHFPTPKAYMDRSYLWVVKSPKYLDEEKIKILKALVNAPNKRINPNEFTHPYVPVQT
jgi:hypothetical protein